MRKITTWSGLRAEIKAGPAGDRARALSKRIEAFNDQPLSALCEVLIVEPSDGLSDLERKLGQALDPPPWEYLTQADGWYELVLVTGNDGFGFVVLIPDQPGIAPELLAYCRTLAI